MTVEMEDKHYEGLDSFTKVELQIVISYVMGGLIVANKIYMLEAAIDHVEERRKSLGNVG